MKPTHPKYKIKQGDTLQSITKLFGIEEDIWIRYHNTMCRLDDIIRNRLPQHLEEIYLLPELWEKETSLSHTSENNKEASHKATRGVKNKNSEQKLLASWAVYPRLNNLNHGYWFRYILEDENSSTEIRYKILVRYIREETDETDLYLIHHISDTYINDQLPNLCMDELAYETGKVFYPMVVEVDKKAQWVSLRNYQQIKRNWLNTVRPYVVLRFSGDIGLEYLFKMDKIIDSKDKIEEILKNDTFFRVYFGTFYHSYSQRFEIERVLKFHAGSNPSALFKVKCRLNRTLTDKGYKEIIQIGTGLINDAPGDQDEFTEDEKTYYSSRILLETKTNDVREVAIEWGIKNTRQRTKLILYPLRQQYEEKVDIKIDKIKNNQGLFS